MSRTKERTFLRRFRRNLNRNIEDRLYTNDEFYRCVLKLRHPNWLTAILHIRRLSLERPLAYMKIYECEFCDGLHVTTGRSDKDYFKLQRSLVNLKRKMGGISRRLPRKYRLDTRKLSLTCNPGWSNWRKCNVSSP